MGEQTRDTKRTVCAEDGFFGPATEIITNDVSGRRSNSFKLGSRPREIKDLVRRQYRRNSIHLNSNNTVPDVDENIKASVHSAAEEEDTAAKLLIEREHEVINLQDVRIVPLTDENLYPGPPDSRVEEPESIKSMVE